MIFIVLELAFVLILFLSKSHNKCYYVLVAMQLLPIIMGPLVDKSIMFDSVLTYFNVFFCCLNLYLIISPWRFACFDNFIIKDFGFLLFFQKYLYWVLKFTLINNIIVLTIVYLFIPDIATFKASLGFHELYDSIPYFGLLFRYTSVSRFFGLFALPYFIYYLSVGERKKSLKALFLSSSTFIAALAFYSRSQIVTYILILLCVYLYSYGAINSLVKPRIDKYIRLIIIGVAILFIGITISRFAGMHYYGDRIPQTSIIQDPILYSVADYSSKGFTNGINQLEVHTDDDILYGRQCFYSLYLTLSYFQVVRGWNIDDFVEKIQRSYLKNKLGEENDMGSFHGYTCRMVKNFGYSFTLILNLIFYFYVKRKTYHKKKIYFSHFVVLTFLLSEPIISIFGMDYDMMSFPLLFYLLIRFFYKISNLKIKQIQYESN